MEIIKDLGMKNVEGRNYRKRFGIFKCKCGKEVELIMTHGKNVKNCGCDKSHLKSHRKNLNCKFFA